MAEREKISQQSSGSTSGADARQEADPAVLLAPGSQTAPTWQNPLAFVAAGTPMTVSRQGTVLAESSEVIVVHEQGHQPVSYFPRCDVVLDGLRVVDHSTHCPRKGDASYFAPARETANILIAWSYEDPIPQAKILKDYVAFYDDKVDLHKGI